MIAILLLQYYDAEPPIKLHIYSHTSNVTLLELFYLRNRHVVLINLVTPDKLTQDLGSQGHLRRENIIIKSCLRLFPLLAEKHIAPKIVANSNIVTFRDRKETTIDLCIVNLRVAVQFAFKLGYLLWYRFRLCGD
jgi:hypothetical protein